MNIVEPYKGASAVARRLRVHHSDLRPWALRWKPVCSSTEVVLSHWLQVNPLLGNQPRAILADRQIFGIGQRGKRWSAPLGGVWISAAIPILDTNQTTGLLGLAVAVALSDRLDKKGVTTQIKWPNDLLVGERKLAGILTRLVHRGGLVRYARIGLGLNVFNRVPKEGIALVETLNSSNCHVDFWAAEVLHAFEKAIKLLGNPQALCAQAESRFWAKEVLDSRNGEIWEINGLEINGELILTKGSISKTLSCWE